MYVPKFLIRTPRIGSYSTDPVGKKSDEEMHAALLLHCYDEFSRPAHASMHSRCNCPVEKKSNDYKHAALKHVQNTIGTEKQYS